MLAITGSSGLLGSCVAIEAQKREMPFRALVREGRSHALTALGVEPSIVHEADILDMSALRKAFKGVDVVVHCAAQVSFNPRDKKKIYDVNVGGTSNVVNACLEQGVRKLIHVSSVAAFGRQKKSTVITEGARWIPGVKQTDYGESKYFAELEVYRGMEEGLQVMLVNPSVILAAADGFRSSSRFFSYAWAERPFFTDFSVGYVDVRDVVEMIFRLIDSSANGEKFIANAGQVGVGQLLKEIALRIKKTPPSIRLRGGFIECLAVAEDLRSWLTGSAPLISRQSLMLLKDAAVFDNAKAKTRLGIEFRTLEDTLDWCCAEFLTFTTNK
jgi:dihydroflavonol-4-reductase